MIVLIYAPSCYPSTRARVNPHPRVHVCDIVLIYAPSVDLSTRARVNPAPASTRVQYRVQSLTGKPNKSQLPAEIRGGITKRGVNPFISLLPLTLQRQSFSVTSLPASRR